MRLLPAALFLAALPAAAGTSAPLSVLSSSREPAERAAACAALAADPARGPEAEAALSAAMIADLSPEVRLAAAKARETYMDESAAPLLERYFRLEPDEAGRAALAVSVSTEPAQAANPDVTRVLVQLLADDPSARVRRAAIRALLARDDARVLPALGRAAEKDADARTRAAAAAAARTVARRPPPAKPRPKPRPKPSPDAVKGVDPCLDPWAWCECGLPPTIRAHCTPREECVRRDLDTYRPLGQGCSWNGLPLRPDQTPRAVEDEKLE